MIFFENKTKLYSLTFPLWMAMLFPFTAIPALGLLFISCMIAQWVVLMIIKAQDIKSVFKKTFIFVWLSSAVSSVICGLLIYLSGTADKNGAFYEYVSLPLTYDPLDNIFSFLYIISAVLLAFALIYVINRFLIFKKTGRARLAALLLAVLTAPWIFLIPTGGGFKSNHIVWQKYVECEVCVIENGQKMTVKEKYDSISHSEDAIIKNNFKKLEHYLYLAVITADKTAEKEAKDAEYTAVFKNPLKEGDVMPEISFWTDGERLMFKWGGSIYRASEEKSRDVLRELNWQ